MTESRDLTKSDAKGADSEADKPGMTTKMATTAEKEESTTITTSASAFSSSGLAGFSSQSSPFLQAGTKPLSSFASASGSTSPFGAAQSSTPSVFGGNSLSNGSSPFGHIGGASKPFGGSSFGGSAFGGAFGSPIGGNKLTTFGSAGQSFKSSKPAKPFGAPESDEEDGGEDNEEAASEDDGKAASEDRDGEDKSAAVDDKKKTRLQRGK